MSILLSDPDFTLHHGDVRDVLPTLPAESVDCVVTSPPYWGLRDYGVSGQLGLEATPDEYVTSMVAVFAEVRRVLRPAGTLWLNIGDSYNANTGRGFDTNQDGDTNGKKAAAALNQRIPWGKPKDLVGIPWLLAFALRADGWYLRSEIIWAKPNPMPESVTDRPTKAHEQVFLLSKRPRYWYDAEAIREPHTPDGRTITRVVGQNGSLQHRDGERWPGTGRNARTVWEIATEPYPDAHFATFPTELARRAILAGCPEQVCQTCGKARERITELDADYRARLVQRQRPEPIGAWLREKRQAAGLRQSEVAALFPSRTGGLTGCVSNWELDKNVPTAEQWPILKTALALGDAKDALLHAWHEYERGLWGVTTNPLTHGAPSAAPALPKNPRTVGWSDCGHNDYRPGVVLDPFLGSGTVAWVARHHGRRSIGVELSADYCDLAARRMQQLSLLAAREASH